MYTLCIFILYTTYCRLLIKTPNFAFMAKVHIGKKIREVLDKSHYTIVEFAKKINLTRDGAYKIFEKESIASDQLEKISKVLNHDFFSYYQHRLNLANESESKYGFASKEDVEELSKLVRTLAKEIEKMREENSAPKKSGKDGKKKKK